MSGAAEESAEIEFEVGSLVLGYDSESGEWRAAEIIALLETGYKVHFDDDPDDKTVDLSEEEVQPLEPERFQVGDQVMGYFEAEGAFYPCEIVEVLESTYVVHFFDTPDQDLYELDETQVMEERVMEEGTPIFAFLENEEKWVKGVVSQPTETGYVVHLDGTPEDQLVELAEDNVYPIEVKEGDDVYAWFESASDPADGEWMLATLRGITDVGYRVHFHSAPEGELVDLSPDRVRAEGDLMEMMPEGDDEEATA